MLSARGTMFLLLAAAWTQTPRSSDSLGNHVIVTGRCVAAETGEPLRGCIVRFEARREESLTATTGADGRFEIRFEPGDPPSTGYILDIEFEGRAPRTGRWFSIPPGEDEEDELWRSVPSLRAGEVEDLGDIAFSRGLTVKGQVVDTNGKALVGAGVGLRELPLPIHPDMAANDSRYGWSDEGGFFIIDVLIPAGTWPVEVNARGYELVEPKALTVEDGRAVTEFRAVVVRQRSLSGLLIDETGTAVEGVTIQTVKKVSGRMESCWSDESGRFRIFGGEDAPESVQLECDESEGYEALEDDRFFAWGTTDITLVLRRTLAVDLWVTEKETGQPVEEFAARSFSTDHSKLCDCSIRWFGPHPDGHAVLEAVSRGENFLQIIPDDPSLAVIDVLFEMSQSGIPPLKVAVERMVPLSVRVLSDAGEPIPDTEVELLKPGGTEVRLEDMVGDPREDQTWDNEQNHRLLSTAMTDTKGLATLHSPREVSGLVIRVRGAGHLPGVFHEVAIAADGSPFQVVVGRGACVQGTITGMPASYVESYQPSVELWPATGSESDFRWWPLDAGGSFVVESVPPGDYKVRLGLLIRCTSRDGSGSYMDRSLSLSTVHVVAGQRATLDLDVSAFAPGRLIGRLILDAELLASAGVALCGGLEDDEQWTLGEFIPNQAGELVAENLLPGKYRAVAVFNDEEHLLHGFLVSSDPFVIAPGQELTREFSFPPRKRLRIQILDPKGRPLGRTPCDISSDRTEIGLITDRHGWITLDPAPGVPFWLSAESKATGAVEISEGQDETSRVVQLPAQESDER